jgi:MSHA biogenesis protein MshK
MAERLTPALLGLALSAALPALAQTATLSDPTRPPNASMAGAAGAASDPATPAGPRLQSVLISPDRKLAIIDGETVALGGSVGGATLVQITETGVTLRRGAEVTRLELYPGVVLHAGRAGGDKNKEGKP